MFTNKKLSIKNSRRIIVLILLILWLLFLSYIMSPYYGLVNDYLDKSLLLEDKGKLILAALILVLIYTISEIVIFLAAIYLGKIVQNLYGKWESICVMFITVIGSYFLLTITSDYTLALATPIITMIIYLTLVFKLNIWKGKFRYQAIIIFQLLIALQWLEITPALQQFGFGKSESVQLIIQTAYQLQGAHILQIISLLISIPFFVSFCLTFTLIHINMLRSKELDLIKRNEQELEEMRTEAIESRLNDEMHSLVHDLKTPLTTIRGLISLVHLRFQKHNLDLKIDEYIVRIEGSVQQLDEMISEILYKEKKRESTLQELIDYTSANFVEQHKQEVNFTNHNPEVFVYINRIRLVRALINLIQNAIDATENQEDGVIDIDIRYTQAYAQGTKQEGVLITVTDNGEGISDVHIMRIWNVNYSMKGSSGLGLPFVKKVVNDHNGWIKIESQLDEGTIFTIFLPKGSEK